MQDDLLHLDDASFVNSVKGIANHPLMSGSMCLIAYENLKIIMSVSFDQAKENPDQDLPRDLDSFVRFIERGIEEQTDEYARRRRTWFYLASLIYRATEKARNDSTLVDPVAELWLYLAMSGALLEDVVRNNILWSASEKEWFEHILTPYDGVNYVLTIMLPSFLKEHGTIREFAQKYDVLLQ